VTGARERDWGAGTGVVGEGESRRTGSCFIIFIPKFKAYSNL